MRHRIKGRLAACGWLDSGGFRGGSAERRVIICDSLFFLTSDFFWRAPEV
jgi:hypothetical protein